MKFLMVGLSALLFVGCTQSGSVPLQAPPAAPAPQNPGENGGDAKPAPTPGPGKPTPTPRPGEPTPTPRPGEPTPTPTPKPVAKVYPRIYCTSASSASKSMNIIPGSAAEDFNPTVVDFALEDGTAARYIKFPVALKNSGAEGLAILKAGFGNSSDPQKIYKAKIDHSIGRAVMKQLSSYSSEPNGLPYVQQNLDLPLTMLAANESKTAIAYPNDRGNYVVESLAGGKVDTGVSADRSANPRFLRDTWVVFDHQVSNYKVSQKFFSIKSGKTSSLSSSSDAYQLSGFVSSAKGTKFWIEGLPRSGWKLKTDGSSKSSTIMTLPGNGADIQLPAVFFEIDGKVHLAYIEEKIAVDQKGILFVKTGKLHVLEINSDLSVSTSKSTEFSDSIKQFIVRPKTNSAELLRSLTYEPIEKKLYASNLAAGGLVSLNLSDKSWGIHANRDQCFYPSMGLEESYE